MERNRLLARILDGVMLVGLALYVAVIVIIAQRNIEAPIRPLLVWCCLVWIGPSLARFLILPASSSAIASTGRYALYSDNRDVARPAAWMLVARWIVAPLVIAGVLYYLNGRVALVASIVQAVIVVILFAAFFRGTIELCTLIATSLMPARAASVRRRVERAWNMVYFLGPPLLLLSRYQS